jgi:RNA polymerase sigma-70 factor (ECF subfamily)
VDNADHPPPPDPPLDEKIFADWIEAARKGCQESFNRLFTACRPYLLSVANRELGTHLEPKVAPSDLVQETLARAQEVFDRFHGSSEAELLAWTRGVLLKNIMMAKRQYLGTAKRQASRETSLDRELAGFQLLADVQQAPPGHQLDLQDDALRLSDALTQLPIDQREVLRLRHWEEQSFEQIGCCLNRSPDAARKLWARAVDELRRILDRGDFAGS